MKQRLMGEVFKNRRKTHGVLGRERYGWVLVWNRIYGYAIGTNQNAGVLRYEVIK